MVYTEWISHFRIKQFQCDDNYLYPQHRRFNIMDVAAAIIFRLDQRSFNNISLPLLLYAYTVAK